MAYYYDYTYIKWQINMDVEFVGIFLRGPDWDLPSVRYPQGSLSRADHVGFYGGRFRV